MLYTKDGYPEPNEIVLCNVKKIYGNTTFVDLIEYEKEGVLTISEIAPGRIRNLREYVVENKTIICKVLRIDAKGRRIDVSLRRVPLPVMKKKLEEIKKEEYSERIYVDVAKETNTTKEDLFERTYAVIFDTYGTVFEALYEVMLDNTKVSIFNELKDVEKESFIKIINDRIKPEEVIFKEKFVLSSKMINGVELIKKSITNSLEPLNYEKFQITYTAAGKYEIVITHDDMKSANILYDKFRENLEKEAKENNLDLIIKEH
ncbi:MAG: S1 RNA-binding domain-containing protein [Candidatus Woesearchaeota archaeon]|jgi:translation initiation factor 2 alpha subunit (eIF-2alpha)|nr:S1 RNA-binding domain-containing protein [Candidatus Woesearchaeota archaeon]